MIEKFISIKNIGRFRDCSPRGDVTFRKLTLLFAENGHGKTTLCAILRSLQSGQPEFIFERKTLGTTDTASVQIRLDSSNLTFGNNGWSDPHPDIAVFDAVFIHQNVYAGDFVDHEHKKNLYRVIVGAQGVQLARTIEDLDDQIRNANTDIRTKKEAVSRTLPSGTTLDAYLTLQPVEDIETKIQQKNKEIDNRQRSIEKAAEIQSKGLLAKIALPTFPSEFNATLTKHLEDIAADAEARVRQQVVSHQMGSQGETWLSQGMGFIVDEKCPFCGQGITANDLIAAYRSHFNAAYKALKQEVAQLNQKITSAIGDSTLYPAQQTLSSNLALVEFWKQFADVTLPTIPIEEIRAKYASLRDLALGLAQRKEQSPTEAVLPTTDFQAALGVVVGLQELVKSYDTSVETCNERINEQKSLAQQGGDINLFKRELADLEANNKRFEPEVVQACKEFQEALTAKAALDQRKADAKRQLDQHCEEILQTYERDINTYLDQFGTGFRIMNTRHQYTGGTPSSHYQIQINNNPVDLGDSRTQPGTPCFKTTLSSGDRSALALAFFLAALKQDPEIGNKIVVLDDPFTSQDRFRRTCTQQLIRHSAAVAKQVIVLSHDPHFLRLVWEGYSQSEIKLLQLLQTGDNITIGEWDIEAETQSTYMKDYSALLDFYRERKGTPLEVARSIRPFIEGLLRAHFPGHFQPSEWLGDFIVKIRNAGVTDGLQHAQADLPEIEAINDYSKKYHHEQNSNAAPEPLSPDELHGFVRRTLRFVGGC